MLALVLPYDVEAKPIAVLFEFEPEALVSAPTAVLLPLTVPLLAFEVSPMAVLPAMVSARPCLGARTAGHALAAIGRRRSVQRDPTDWPEPGQT